MDTLPPDEYVRERPRKPHWKKPHFWKTFGMVLVIYFVLRILIGQAADWSRGPAESEPEPAPPVESATDQSASG